MKRLAILLIALGLSSIVAAGLLALTCSQLLAFQQNEQINRAQQNARAGMGDIPASTPESDRMSKTMKRDGFRFVGTTICYAHMQATGMVNDHVVTCPRHSAVAALG